MDGADGLPIGFVSSHVSVKVVDEVVIGNLRGLGCENFVNNVMDVDLFDHGTLAKAQHLIANAIFIK